MKNKLITSTLVAGFSLTTQAQDYTASSVYALDMRDRYVITQVYVAPVVVIREEKTAHEKLIQAYKNLAETYRRSTEEMTAKSAEWELYQQTQELRKQTRLLRKIANE